MGHFLKQMLQVHRFFFFFNPMTAVGAPMGDELVGWSTGCPHGRNCCHVSLPVAVQQAEDRSGVLSLYLQAEASLQLSQGC